MNNTPLISIAIPTYNRSKLFIRALESVLCQTYKNLEIIISNNNSTDDTDLICKKYAKMDSRIKYFKQEKNIGIGPNAEFISNQATGEYFCILNDDDYINSCYIEECYNTLKRNKVDFTLGRVVLFDENFTILKICEIFNATQNSKEKRANEYAKIGIYNFIFSVFCKTEIYKKCYTNYNADRFCEDQISLFKFLCEGKFLTSENAIYHKLNNGNTKDLETLKKAFNLPDLTPLNYLEFLAQTHADAIMCDEYYKKYVPNYKKYADNVKKFILQGPKRK